MYSGSYFSIFTWPPSTALAALAPCAALFVCCACLQPSLYVWHFSASSSLDQTAELVVYLVFLSSRIDWHEMTLQLEHDWHGAFDTTDDFWNAEFGDFVLFDDSPTDTSTSDMMTPSYMFGDDMPLNIAQPVFDDQPAGFRHFDLAMPELNQYSYCNPSDIDASKSSTALLEPPRPAPCPFTSSPTTLKESVQAIARLDSRRISQQEKQRDAFIALQLHHSEAICTAASPANEPVSIHTSTATTACSDPPYWQAMDNNGADQSLEPCNPASWATALSGGVDQEYQYAQSIPPTAAPAPQYRGGGASIHHSSMTLTELNGVSPQQPTSSAPCRVESSGQPLAEMVWTQNMDPAAHIPKQKRTKEENAARRAVRRLGGACVKHKTNKKAVSTDEVMVTLTCSNNLAVPLQETSIAISFSFQRSQCHSRRTIYRSIPSVVQSNSTPDYN